MGQITAINTAISSINSQIAAINAAIAKGVWYDITDSAVGGTYSTGWGATYMSYVNTLQIKKDGSGNIRLRGSAIFAPGGGAGLQMFTLPSGSPYAPAAVETFVCELLIIDTGEYLYNSLSIN